MMTSSYSLSSTWDSAITIFPYIGKKIPYQLKVNRYNHEASANLLFASIMVHLEGCSKNPNIEYAAVFKTPLEGYREIPDLLYHAFINFQIENYFATIEKHDTGLTIQVSKDNSEVVTKLKDERRIDTPEKIIYDKAKVNLKKLVKYIIKNDFVTEGYDFQRGIHCKKFAKDIFDRIATTKEYDWTEEEVARYSVKAVVTAAAGAVGWFMGGPVVSVVVTTATAALTNTISPPMTRRAIRRSHSRDFASSDFASSDFASSDSSISKMSVNTVAEKANQLPIAERANQLPTAEKANQLSTAAKSKKKVSWWNCYCCVPKKRNRSRNYKK